MFFMFAMAKKVCSKAVEQLSLRGPMLSARFGHGSAFSSGGQGFFFFFLGEGGVSFSLFLFLLGREGVSIENFRAGEGVH